MNDQDIKKLQNWLGSGSINVFGRPFSGKDTQAKKLAQLFDAPIIGGGDIIRGSNQEDIKAIVSSGNLAPSEQYLAMVLPYFNQARFAGHPIILSSVGRWLGEETSVISALKQSDHSLKMAVLLDISEETVYKRWQAAKLLADRGRRQDDEEETIHTRLQEFREKTLPVIEVYRKLGLLIEINGEPEPEVVTAELIEELHRQAGSSKK